MNVETWVKRKFVEIFRCVKNYGKYYRCKMNKLLPQNLQINLNRKCKLEDHNGCFRL